MSDKEKGMESQVGLTSDDGYSSAAAAAKPNTFCYMAILVRLHPSLHLVAGFLESETFKALHIFVPNINDFSFFMFALLL